MGRVNATFAGYKLAESGVEISRTLGASPNVHPVQFAVGGSVALPEYGDLILTDGTETIVFNEMYPELAEDAHTERGRAWVGFIKDVRWKWAHFPITREFNKPNADGTPNNEDYLKTIVDWVLGHLPQGGTDTSALLTAAGKAYPHVKWEYNAAASCLDSVLADYGFALHLSPANVVTVVALGHGTRVAFASTDCSQARTGKKKVFPYTKITVVGGRKIIQRESTLVPVGLDTDGAIKELADLSYAPSPVSEYGGFYTYPKQVYDQEFDFLRGLGEGDAEVACAKASVYRWFSIPLEERIYLPIRPKIVMTATGIEGSLLPLDPILGYDYMLARNGGLLWRIGAALGGPVQGGYQIDQNQGVVKITDDKIEPWFHATAGDPTSAISPTTFTLTWAYESLGFAWDDYGFTGTEPQRLYEEDYYNRSEALDADALWPIEYLERVPELQLRGVKGTNPDTSIVWSNETELNTWADARIALIKREMGFQNSAEIRVIGLVDPGASGYVQSISWSVSGEGAVTTLSMNDAHPKPNRKTYEDRLFSSETRLRRDAQEVVQAWLQEQAKEEG